MLPREIRRGFFQERVFHLKLADTAFQLTDPLIVRHIGRQGLAGEFLPVCLHPEPECSIIDIEFPRHLGDRPRRRGVDHFSDGLLLELRSVMLRFPRHLIPFLSGESYWIPCPENLGHLTPPLYPGASFYTAARPAPGTNGFAIASFVLGLLGGV